MSINKNRYMKQTCVYWAPRSTESGEQAVDMYGQPIYTDPVEKKCRWEDTAVIFVNMKGVEETSKAMVFIDDVQIGGLLMLTDLSSALELVNPRQNDQAWEIRQLETVPNRTATINYTWAYL